VCDEGGGVYSKAIGKVIVAEGRWFFLSYSLRISSKSNSVIFFIITRKTTVKTGS